MTVSYMVRIWPDLPERHTLHVEIFTKQLEAFDQLCHWSDLNIYAEMIRAEDGKALLIMATTALESKHGR